jgi:hypothetical protein
MTRKTGVFACPDILPSMTHLDEPLLEQSPREVGGN